MEAFDLTGRVAVVTGGGQGIGEGIAKNLAKAGASVVVAARHADRIARVADDIIAAGGQALAVTTDVTDRAALVALAEAAVDTFGGLHVWVNNAGGSTIRTPLKELSEDDWDACLRLNLTSVWSASIIAAERMTDGGSIINISSPAGDRGVPGSGHYAAAKAGVNSLTKTLSLELAPSVRVNGISPGYVPTEVMMIALDTDEAQLEQMADEAHPAQTARHTRRHGFDRCLPRQRRRQLDDRSDTHRGRGALIMLDQVIKGGTIVDGSGAPPVRGDVAVKDGRIVQVGGTITDAASDTIDADGAIVTPGWVDVHTHYDGQVSWDDVMDPSAGNGVTTIVMGNCGVGFAPVRPGGEKSLIELMEGVEDIPGTALYEGMEWGQWETFPDYLDYIAGREYSLDIGAQIAHGAVRYYVMGERGSDNEDATSDDLAEMARLVQEALEAGAVGFSTSRTIGHRSLWGSPVPGTFAPEEELRAIAHAMKAAGSGVFEMIPSGTVGKMEALGGERYSPLEELH